VDFVKEHLVQILGGAAALVLLYLVVKILSPKKKVFAEGMTLTVRCKACRWTGTVTKYNAVCRGCNSMDLEVLKGPPA
jgi:ubiquitin